MTQPTITADLKSAGSATDPERSGRSRCDELLATLTPFRRVVLVSHVNPDPDSLASMLGMQALLESAQPGKPIILTVDGMIARSENRAMVELIPIPLVPVETVAVDAETAVVMVDTQPHTGRRYSEAAMPQVVIDHHDTGGLLDGRALCDIRASIGRDQHDRDQLPDREGRLGAAQAGHGACSTESSPRRRAIRARPARSTTGP